MLKLCPGVRPAWAPAKGDQARVATPADAIAAGADGVVVGRPILKPPEGIGIQEALRRIADEVRIIQLFQKHGGLLTGHFVLKSGRHSDRYLNKDVLFPHEDVMEEVASMLADIVFRDWQPELDVEPSGCYVIGPESIGAKAARFDIRFWLPALAERLGRKLGNMAWRGVKKDGAGGFLADGIPTGKNVLLVEDVLTTGGSIGKVYDLVKAKGNRIVAIFGLINRGGVQMPGLRTLASMNVESWTPEECPLCKMGIPISTEIGHGGNKAK